MFDDFFYQIHRGEIFEKSLCMQHEQTIANFFSSMLSNLGYTTQDPARRRWQRGNKTVIVCLADDFNICGADFSKPPGAWYDPDTVIITDNHVTFYSQYTVLQLPESYFGVFNYQPQDQNYRPGRRFNFSVNRLDAQRELILCELVKQSQGLNQILQNDYINFNAWDAQGSNNSLTDIKYNFSKYWATLTELDNSYTTIMHDVVEHLPIRNHDMTVEQSHVQAWLVPVIETYSGNHTMAFSEKIFRALVTPVPWTLYSATGAVEYLKSLNFDVLEDLVGHHYNQLEQDSPYGLKKIKAFVEHSIHTVQQLKIKDFQQVKQRCFQAARHNQQVLHKLQQQWPVDFSTWLPQVVAKII